MQKLINSNRILPLMKIELLLHYECTTLVEAIAGHRKLGTGLQTFSRARLDHMTKTSKFNVPAHASTSTSCTLSSKMAKRPGQVIGLCGLDAAIQAAIQSDEEFYGLTLDLH